MQKLERHLRRIELTRSLFGNKPIELELYAEGLMIRYKKEERQYLFSQIKRIHSDDYFVPLPSSYAFEVITAEGEKITFSIPYVRFEDARALLMVHANYLLPEGFQDNIMQFAYVLDDYLTWEKGTLVYRGRKGTVEYPASAIEDFVEKNGLYYFTMKDSKDTRVMNVLHAPQNCLASIWIGQAIAGKYMVI
jgi:hypothetical protein